MGIRLAEEPHHGAVDYGLTVLDDRELRPTDISHKNTDRDIHPCMGQIVIMVSGSLHCLGKGIVIPFLGRNRKTFERFSYPGQQGSNAHQIRHSFCVPFPTRAFENWQTPPVE